MRKASRGASGVLLLLVCLGPAARADDPAPGSMSIPVTVGDLAAAAGIRRVDPSTVSLDIIRLAFAAPEGLNQSAAGQRAAVVRALERSGDSGDRLPLPLSPAIWRAHVFRRNQVPDDRLAGAILRQRSTALLYHGLVAMDAATLAWIEAHPAVLEPLQKQPGVTAAFARSIRIRDGVVATPGDDAKGVWEALVGADPGDPASFVAKLLASRSGRVAAFYDTVAHLDAARQRFALGTPADAGRVDRARRLLDAVTRDSFPWRLEEFPFLRPDVDAALLFRGIALDARGVPVGPSRRTWARVFGDGGEADGPVDAEWLALNVLTPTGGGARRRFDTVMFAQRALASDTAADPATLVSVLRDFPRYPALMLILENNGVRTAAAYADARRGAAALDRDDEAMTVFQAGLTLVDRARLAGTLRAEEARTLIGSLTAAAASREGRAALLTWMKGDLLPALRRSPDAAGTPSMDGESLVLRALAGPRPIRPAVVEWEGQRYSADVAHAELRRLTTIRRGQQEPPLDEALASATPRKLETLAHSLAGLVYAIAIGEPESQAVNAGSVWRRHRLGGPSDAPGAETTAWRTAVEVFGPGGWRLTGSLLRLDLALAHLALRRLDPTEMPAVSSLSTMDRRTLARTLAVIDPREMADGEPDAVAAALKRGRARIAGLAAHPQAFDDIAAEAALSEWRRAAIRWLLAHDAARVPGAFTMLETFRLGGGTASPALGVSAEPLEGCFCLGFPRATAWEEYTGRAATGQLATQLADVMLRTAEALSARRLPALLLRGVMTFALQDAMDAARPAHFDDWLSVAFAARDLRDDQFDDYVAALTAAGPLVPIPRR